MARTFCCPSGKSQTDAAPTACSSMQAPSYRESISQRARDLQAAACADSDPALPWGLPHSRQQSGAGAAPACLLDARQQGLRFTRTHAASDARTLHNQGPKPSGFATMHAELPPQACSTPPLLKRMPLQTRKGGEGAVRPRCWGRMSGQRAAAGTRSTSSGRRSAASGAAFCTASSATHWCVISARRWPCGC